MIHLEPAVAIRVEPDRHRFAEGAALSSSLDVEVELDRGVVTARANPPLVSPIRPGDELMIAVPTRRGAAASRLEGLVICRGADIWSGSARGAVSSDGLLGAPIVVPPSSRTADAVAVGARASGATRLAALGLGRVEHTMDVLRSEGLVELAVAAGEAHGGVNRVSPTAWTGLLEAVSVDHADVVVLVCDEDTSIVGASFPGICLLGGRPVVALELAAGHPLHLPPGGTSSVMLGSSPGVGVEVAVPALEDDRTRTALWDSLRAARLEERHHLVEVEGRPALTELTRRDRLARGADPSVPTLAAGAAGVLAGRMAVAARAWRPPRPAAAGHEEL